MLTVSSASAEREIALPARRAAEAKRAAIARYYYYYYHYSYYFSCSIGWCALPPRRWEPHQPRGVNEGTKGRGWAAAWGRGAGAEPRGAGAEPRGTPRRGAGRRPRTAGSAGGNAVGFFTGSFSQRRILLHA